MEFSQIKHILISAFNWNDWCKKTSFCTFHSSVKKFYPVSLNDRQFIRWKKDTILLRETDKSLKWWTARKMDENSNRIAASVYSKRSRKHAFTNYRNVGGNRGWLLTEKAKSFLIKVVFTVFLFKDKNLNPNNRL